MNLHRVRAAIAHICTEADHMPGLPARGIVSVVVTVTAGGKRHCSSQVQKRKLKLGGKGDFFRVSQLVSAGTLSEVWTVFS